MANRPGADLENLVGAIEHALAGTGLTVKLREKVRGQDSKSLRECDITIRGKFGSTDIFTIVEVRDRGKKDITWIGEIRTKRDDVRANKAIAVSKSGFSSGARGLAEQHAIELRTVKRPDRPDELLGKLLPEGYFHLDLRFELAHVEVIIDRRTIPPGVEVPTGETKIQTAAPLLTATKSGEVTSVDQALNGGVGQHLEHLLERFAPDQIGERVVEKANLHFGYQKDDRFRIKTTFGEVDVQALRFKGRLTVTRKLGEVFDVAEYQADSGDLIARSVTIGAAGQPETAVTFHQVPTEKGLEIRLAPSRARAVTEAARKRAGP